MSVHHVPASAYMPDVSAPGSTWAIAPRSGRIVAVRSVLHGAITVANAVVTTKIGGVTVTGGTLTIAATGSAAGVTDSATPTANNYVTAGQAIEFASDGGSTTTAACTFMAVIN